MQFTQKCFGILKRITFYYRDSASRRLPTAVAVHALPGVPPTKGCLSLASMHIPHTIWHLSYTQHIYRTPHVNPSTPSPLPSIAVTLSFFYRSKHTHDQTTESSSPFVWERRAHACITTTALAPMRGLTHAGSERAQRTAKQTTHQRGRRMHAVAGGGRGAP